MYEKMNYNFYLIVFVITFSRVARCDQYVDEALETCNRDAGLISCGKYKTIKYISTLVEPINDTSMSTIRFVNLRPSNVTTTPMYPTIRSEDGEFTKFKNFLQRKVIDFFKFQGLAFELPDSVQVLNGESEVRKLENNLLFFRFLLRTFL